MDNSPLATPLNNLIKTFSCTFVLSVNMKSFCGQHVKRFQYINWHTYQSIGHMEMHVKLTAIPGPSHDIWRGLIHLNTWNCPFAIGVCTFLNFHPTFTHSKPWSDYRYSCFFKISLTRFKSLHMQIFLGSAWQMLNPCPPE